MINLKKYEKYVKKNAQVIDLRSPVDFRNSHVENSINLPLKNFCNKLSTFDKKGYILLICVNKTDQDVVQAINYAELFKIENIMPIEYSDLLKLKNSEKTLEKV
jgi:tRNA 2-selenouridine synthase SelU